MMDLFSYLKYGFYKVISRMRIISADYQGWLDYKTFIIEMNKTAHNIGLKRSKFRNPSGANSWSKTCPVDLLTLGEYALSNEFILKMWGSLARNIQILGPNERHVQIDNSVLKDGKPIMGDYLLGGKSGSWGDTNKAHLFLCKSAGKQVLFSVLANDAYSFCHIYEIGFELCRLTEGKCDQAMALKRLEAHKGGYIGEFVGDSTKIVSYNEKKKFLPASTTKVLTALVALSINPLKNGFISVRELDIMGGSGSEYYTEDQIQFEDALYAMMLESSNTMANAIARTCGHSLRCNRKRTQES